MGSRVNNVNSQMTNSINTESKRINNILQTNRDLKTENKVYNGLLVTCIVLFFFYGFTYYFLYNKLFKLIINNTNPEKPEYRDTKSIIETVKKSYQFGIFLLYVIFSLVIFGTCVVFNNLVFPNIKMDINNTATISFVSYFFIVGFTLLTIHFVAPGLITIFENTIGYGFLNAFFPKSLNSAINGEEDQINKYKKTIDKKIFHENEEVSLPNSVITNPIFGMNYMCYGGGAADQVPKKVLLGDFILRKHLIGHMCWVYLSSVTALLTSISAYGVYVLNE